MSATPGEDVFEFEEESVAWVRTALYRLYSQDGELLYVGITDTPAERMRTHAREQSWWPEVARKTIVWYAYREQADVAETITIGLECPKYNKAKRYVRLPEQSFVESDDAGRRMPGTGLTRLGDGVRSQDIGGDAGRWNAVLNLPADLNVSLLRMCIQALSEGDGSLPGDPEVLLPTHLQAFVGLAKRTGITRTHRYRLARLWTERGAGTISA